MINSLKNNIRLLLTFYRGYKDYKKTGVTDESAYLAMRNLFVLTNGRFNDFVAFSHKKGKETVGNDIGPNLLGGLSRHKINSIVDNINRDGFYRFKQTLNEDSVQALLNLASSSPSSYLKPDSTGKISFSKDTTVFNKKSIISNRYNFSEELLIRNETVRQLMLDADFYNIAENYLGAQPVIDLVAMWWSTSFKNNATSEAAQLYHFDMDRIKFLKFFIYLTDVTEENGPHCYIKGSHKRLPKEMLKEGRKTDEEVFQAFSINDEKILTGKKGSIFAVDTRGLHKGLPLVKDTRLIFQIEFSINHFGKNYPDVNKYVINNNYPPKLRNTYNKYFIFPE